MILFCNKFVEVVLTCIVSVVDRWFLILRIPICLSQLKSPFVVLHPFISLLRCVISVWYSFVLQFFISALSMATFAVSPELPQNRLHLSFTLLLTTVAFKFVINQNLPRISYLTYMVGSYFSLFDCLTIRCFLCFAVFYQCPVVCHVCGQS